MRYTKKVIGILTFLALFIIAPKKSFAIGTEPKGLNLTTIFKIPKGANSSISGNQVIITENIADQKGSIFSTDSNKMDLTKAFTAEMYIKINGDGDGMTFIMHNDPKATSSYKSASGASLGVYADEVRDTDTTPRLLHQIKNSFVVEFDTYLNSDLNDRWVNNTNLGHVAYSFPDKVDTYTFNGFKIVTQAHNELQYPGFNLGDNKWRKFTIKWKPFNENQIGELTYQLEGLSKVKVPIEESTFDSTNVYWGFTGSTGKETEDARVIFSSIPGLVNYKDSYKAKDTNGNVLTEGNDAVRNSEATFYYTGRYVDGRQNLLNPKIRFELDEYQAYVDGSFLVNGKSVTPQYEKNVLTCALPDLSATNSKLDIRYNVKNLDSGYNRSAKNTSKIIGENYLQNEGKSVVYNTSLGKPIDSRDFDRQTWIIAEIDRQLSPKRIDMNVYYSDLLTIKKLNLDSKGVFTGQHIPKNIAWLENLEVLWLKDKQLTGNLPEELGKLSELKDLRIFGNTFEGGLPDSLGKLTAVNHIMLHNNGLSGTIPKSLEQLKGLKTLTLNDNHFYGQLPTLNNELESLNLENTQLTYNASAMPPSLTGAKKQTAGTFVNQTKEAKLRLVGNQKNVMPIDKINLKPFDPADKGYFNLHAEKGTAKTPIELYQEHTYTIIDKVSGKELYTGTADATVTIPYKDEGEYLVILDGADQNPNNNWTIRCSPYSEYQINFIDEKGTKIHEPYISKNGEIGKKVNVSTLPEISNILNQFLANYILTARPSNETLTINEDDAKNIITYQFNGTLKIFSAPSGFDFAMQEATIKSKTYSSPKILGAPLVISDTRADKLKWNLKAKVDQPLTNKTNKQAKLANAIRYRYQNKELHLNGDNSVIFSHLSTVSGNYDVTQECWAKGDGFVLKLTPGSVKALGQYQAKITIALENAK